MADERVFWQTLNDKDSAHYNIMRVNRPVASGMECLRAMFPDGEANEMNFVLFSTSGVHGTYSTIEDAYAWNSDPENETGGYGEVTFLIIHPRLVVLRYGNCQPENEDDFAYLIKLRASSMKAVLAYDA